MASDDNDNDIIFCSTDIVLVIHYTDRRLSAANTSCCRMAVQ
jgi:hypothetical protein